MTDTAILEFMKKRNISKDTMQKYSECGGTPSTWGYRCLLKELWGFSDDLISFIQETLPKSTIDKKLLKKYLDCASFIDRHKDFIMLTDRNHFLLTLKILEYSDGERIIWSLHKFIDAKDINIIDLYVILEYIGFILFSKTYISGRENHLYPICTYFRYFIDRSYFTANHRVPVVEVVDGHIELFNRFYEYQMGLKHFNNIPEELYDDVMGMIKKTLEPLRIKQQKTKATADDMKARFKEFLKSEENLTAQEYYEKYFPEFSYLEELGKMIQMRSNLSAQARKKNERIREKRISMYDKELSELNAIVKDDPTLDLLQFMRMVKPEMRNLEVVDTYLTGSKKDYPRLTVFLNKFFEIEHRTPFKEVYNEKVTIRGVEITPAIRDAVLMRMKEENFPNYYILYSLMLREYIAEIKEE